MSIVGIDASNLRDGGGRTHLTELLKAAPLDCGIERVIVWASPSTIDTLPTRPWLELRVERVLDGPLPARLFWQRIVLPTLARKHRLSVLFAPGGRAYASCARVVMCRNLLPFEPQERSRYAGVERARLEMLRVSQRASFESADGLIFLSDYARSVVFPMLRQRPRYVETIPHGVASRFRTERPASPRRLDECSPGDPFRLLYVSFLAPYKHQARVARAVTDLQKRMPISIDFVGRPNSPATERAFRAELSELDPNARFLHYHGHVEHSSLPTVYRSADAFVFASSCENLANVLLEAMASGLPIASSWRGPMPEMLGDASVFFDPESVPSIVSALEMLVRDHGLRQTIAARAQQRAAQYNWERTAERTFALLRSVVKENLVHA